MPWSQFLTSPIILRDGRVLVTLRDAANLFGSFSDAIVAHGWVSHAVELLIEAAEDGTAPVIYKATVQVQRALFREGMLSPD
jgi:hypothetical protein